jgi:hypothetical protein
MEEAARRIDAPRVIEVHRLVDVRQQEVFAAERWVHAKSRFDEFMGLAGGVLLAAIR